MRGTKPSCGGVRMSMYVYAGLCVSGNQLTGSAFLVGSTFGCLLLVEFFCCLCFRFR